MCVREQGALAEQLGKAMDEARALSSSALAQANDHCDRLKEPTERD